jgi:hypothetical protein
VSSQSKEQKVDENSMTPPLKCLHCSHEWQPNKNSKGFPKQCSNCHSRRWEQFPIKDRYTSGNNEIFVSDRVFENLYRLKAFPHESFARVIDRIVKGAPSETIVYHNKPKIHCIVVSPAGKEKPGRSKVSMTIKRLMKPFGESCIPESKRKDKVSITINQH